ncbi:hypothetical protein NY78_1603 [Desulfovibrio sp. TomC]|nr:hypothetical protein NY78_1603 [Desulfovibrio sp. TomC]
MWWWSGETSCHALRKRGRAVKAAGRNKGREPIAAVGSRPVPDARVGRVVSDAGERGA